MRPSARKNSDPSSQEQPARERLHPSRGLDLFRSLTEGSRLRALILVACLITCPGGRVHGQSSIVTDTLRREFVEHAFAVKSFGPARWLNEGQAYTTLEPSPAGIRELVRYDSATGQREVLVSAQQLTPSGSQEPLAIEDYTWSSDLNRLLIHTNSKRVWACEHSWRLLGARSQVRESSQTW